MPAHERTALLADLFAAAVAGAAPGPATAAALSRLDFSRWPRAWIFAFGKAAREQSEAVVEALHGAGQAIAGGVIIAPQRFTTPHPSLEVRRGDHPVPGADSLAAATAVGALAPRVAADDVALVLLSGGATSLAAGPVEGADAADLAALFELLLGSGLDIVRVNGIRKRFTRWAAGRLAVALGGAVRCFVVSDVQGDDLASIGAGPCVPDRLRAADVARLLAEGGLLERIPRRLREHLACAVRGDVAETPKPEHSAFARVRSQVVASNRTALQAVATRAVAAGFERVVIAPASLHGEAAPQGAAIADELVALRGRLAVGEGPSRSCVIWGGETTVTLGGAAGKGGRCQELALAAAGRLEAVGGRGITILAAGTDGRDGPTDAAGAVVDADTWRSVRRSGRDPPAALRAHDAYDALDAAGALLRTGLTGTNVGDVVVGIVGAAPDPLPAPG